MLKPVREALILKGGIGENLKATCRPGQVILLAFIIPLLRTPGSRVSRRRLINIVSAVFRRVSAGLLWLWGALGSRLDIPFFLWIGIFNMMIVAQFWGFANDFLFKNEGERLFPIVGFGASIGAVFGFGLAGRLIAPFGIYELMLLGCVLLILQAAVTNLVDSQRHAKRRRRWAKARAQQIRSFGRRNPGPGTNAFNLWF